MNAVITGASMGIGYNLALKLANLGFDLYLTYCNNQEKILTLKEKIETETKVKCYINKLDLQDEKNIIEVSNDIKSKFKNINILVNNASISNDNLFLDKTKNEFMQVLEVNVVGTFLITKYLVSNIKDFVINMSSTDGIDTYSVYNLDYAISKSAIIQLTKSMALIFNNFKTIVVAPNWVDTESTREMDKTYLESELRRIKQKKLISVDTVTNKIIEVINDSTIKSGEVIKIYE